MNDVIFTGQISPSPDESQHAHPHWEFFYCTEGDGRYVSDDLEFPYHEGHLIIIPAELPHIHLFTTDTRGICLYVENVTLFSRYPILLSDDDNHSVRHLIEDAHFLFQHSPELRPSLLPAYGHLIVQHMNVHRANSPRNLLVEEIAQSILRNYPNPNFDLDSVLKSAPYCYDYLCRLFRNEMHITPHQYLSHLRLQTAADILHISTGKSITEVARMCGYQDPLYFSRMFKKKYGISPREYARQNGISPEETPE